MHRHHIQLIFGTINCHSAAMLWYHLSQIVWPFGDHLPCNTFQNSKSTPRNNIAYWTMPGFAYWGYAVLTGTREEVLAQVPCRPAESSAIAGDPSPNLALGFLWKLVVIVTPQFWRDELMIDTDRQAFVVCRAVGGWGCLVGMLCENWDWSTWFGQTSLQRELVHCSQYMTIQHNQNTINENA